MEVKRAERTDSQYFSPGLPGATEAAKNGSRKVVCRYFHGGSEGVAGLPPCNPLEFADGPALSRWSRVTERRKKNKDQERYLYRIAKTAETTEKRIISLRAASAVHWCNKRHIVEKIGTHYHSVGSWSCGKKYCAHCANKKRVKLLKIFEKYFGSTTGKELLEKYDLAMFTVTLQHTKHGMRKNPYYKELATHFRNALKYGAFKTYFAGGFYNTEHTYGKNGHHIHRHALVLIPREYNIYENWQTIENELRGQWKSRTDGSFHVDLTPFGCSKKKNKFVTRQQAFENITENLFEVTKYITKRDDIGTIHWKIVESVELNNRTKFYGRFGCLHRVTQLNMNSDTWELVQGITVIKTSANKKALEKFAEKHKIQGGIIRRIEGEVEVKPGEGRELYVGTVTVKKVKIEGEKYKKRAVEYALTDLIPISDNAISFSQFKESIRFKMCEWRQDKYNALNEGRTVEKWRDRKNRLSSWSLNGLSANENFLSEFTLTSEQYKELNQKKSQ